MNRLTWGTALLICAGLSGCGTSSRATNIERVLGADKAATTGVTSVAEAVARMRAIDLTGCPPDFAAAHVAHTHAWELLADVERDAVRFDADFNSGGAMVEAFVRGLMLDPFGKAREATAEQNRLRANLQRAQAQLRDTLHRVEGTAVAHGASLPRTAGR